MTSYIYNQLTFFAKKDKKYQKLITAIGPIIYENLDLPPTYLSLVGILVFQSYVHKHIAVKYHYNRDLIQSGKIILQYKKTQEMIADGLTKSLSPIAFKEFVK